jgi:hypothetical protein
MGRPPLHGEAMTGAERQRRYMGLFDDAYWGFVMFDPDSPPRFSMVCLGADVELPRRENLGNLDETKWPTSKLNNQKEDLWKEQYIVPLMAKDEGAELFAFVARSPTTRRVMQQVLNRYKMHPRKKLGFKPVIRLGVTTFENNFGNMQPKPSCHSSIGAMSTARPSRDNS